MGSLFTLFTAFGPLAGFCGLALEIPTLFWAGVAVAALNLFMNLVSGAMNFPLLPGVFMALGAAFLSPWYNGAAIGLLAWTAVEAAGETVMPVLLNLRSRRRSL